MIKLQKGEFWRPEDLKDLEEVSVRVAKGVGWVTFKCSHKDIITREGQAVDLSQKETLIEALSDELNLEIEFKKRARSFFGRG